MERHETDLVSLVFGVMFLAVGGVFVSGAVDVGDFVAVWALPLTFVAGGLVLAAFAVNLHRRKNRQDEQTIEF